MSILLAVILVWSILGHITTLWLTLIEWRSTTINAILVGFACGPGVWLFVLSAYIVDRLDRRS